MYYQSRRNFFKNWLGNTNLKPYIVILIFVLLVVGTVLFAGKKHIAEYFAPGDVMDNPGVSDNEEPTNIMETEPATKTTEAETVHGYYIQVNKHDNMVSVWTTVNGEIEEIEKLFVASINQNLSEGNYTIAEKSTWRTLQDYTYVQYSSKAATSMLFHSPVYEIQNRGYMLVNTYQMLGSSNDSVEGITMTVADSKWIYENCGEGTIVNVCTDSQPAYGLTPNELMAIPDGLRWDPTDPDRENMWVQGKIAFLNGVSDKTIPVGGYVDPWEGILAKTEDGRNITNNITVRNYVNNMIPGVYRIEYILADSTGQVIRQFATITVVEETQEPLTEQPPEQTDNEIQALQ